MSDKSTAASQKSATDSTDTAPSKEPGFITRAFSSVTRSEQSFSYNHPIVAGAVSVGLAAGTAAIAAPVVSKAVSAGKRAFGGLARKSSEEVTKEVAGEGVRSFVGGAGRLRKLFR